MTQKSYHTQATRKVNQEVTRLHTEEMAGVMDEVMQMLENRSADYDNLRTFIERMPFGDTSWATLLYIKADRLCSSLAPDIKDVDEARVDDSLIDLIVYAIAYRAWRNIIKDEIATQAIETAAARVRAIDAVTEDAMDARYFKPEPGITVTDGTPMATTSVISELDPRHIMRALSDDGTIDVTHVEQPRPLPEGVSINVRDLPPGPINISAGEAAARSLVGKTNGPAYTRPSARV